MKITTSYNVRLKTKHVCALKQTVRLYTGAVRFFMDVVLKEWDIFYGLSTKAAVSCAESMTHATAQHPDPKYAFDAQFPKFPSYLRRAAISCAYGKCCSYKSNLKNWENSDPASRGKAPSMPKLYAEMPAFYKGNTFERLDTYSAKIKLFVDHDWKYVNVGLRKCDVDYILHHCGFRKEQSPVLRHQHKVWELCFSFREEHTLNTASASDQRILAVDLGINSPCACSVMASDGTVLARHFLKASVEEDSLNHKLNKIKRSQQLGSIRMPKKWASANGTNTMLARKTADYIIRLAVLYNVDVIVMEHLDTAGRKQGSRKQRLHMWRKRAVQNQVELQAHQYGIRFRRVCARNTSRLAFDGSGEVLRGREAGFHTDSICRFQNGKIYNCDLNASYNIGARYFICEFLKSFSERERLPILAKVPECGKRSTCTLASFIKLYAVLTTV